MHQSDRAARTPRACDTCCITHQSDDGCTRCHVTPRRAGSSLRLCVMISQTELFVISRAPHTNRWSQTSEAATLTTVLAVPLRSTWVSATAGGGAGGLARASNRRKALARIKHKNHTPSVALARVEHVQHYLRQVHRADTTFTSHLGTTGQVSAFTFTPRRCCSCTVDANDGFCTRPPLAPYLATTIPPGCHGVGGQEHHHSQRRRTRSPCGCVTKRQVTQCTYRLGGIMLRSTLGPHSV